MSCSQMIFENHLAQAKTRKMWLKMMVERQARTKNLKAQKSVWISFKLQLIESQWCFKKQTYMI